MSKKINQDLNQGPISKSEAKKGRNKMMKLKQIISRCLLFMMVNILMSTTCLSGIALASQTNSLTVGVVDYALLLQQHPETSKANETIRNEIAQAKKEFEEKSAGLSDQERKNLDQQLGQRVEQKRQKLLKPIIEKVNAALKEIADIHGISFVIGKQFAIYGGIDITDEVLKKIGSK